MAEIRVEPKPRSLAWLWILLALAIGAFVAWYLMNTRVVETSPTAALRLPPAALG